LRFGPGASLLASTGRSTLHVWDLSRIREGLRPLGLDWEAEPEPVRPSLSPPIPVSVEGDPGPPRRDTASAARWRREEIARLDEQIQRSPGGARLLARRARKHQELGEWTEAVRDAEEAHRVDPGYRSAMNNLAWMLLIAPDPLRDPARAAALARESLEGTGMKSDALNTLGAACYRLGDYPQAIRHLLESRRLMTEKERPYNDFFLAMTYAKLGERPVAEMYFRKALGSLGQRPPAETDMAAIHDEAVETLGAVPGARKRD